MARLTVSYSIAFIPGLPRPLVLSEVIDDVIGLSTFSSRHSVRKTPGTPDRLDVIVPVDDLEGALDSAATVADELTRIGESLLGLGFVVEERSIRIEGLTDNWLPDTFDGAGSRHHASTDLDAAAPLPDHLDEPVGDVPDEELCLDRLAHLPAADQPSRPEPLREEELLREELLREVEDADAHGEPARFSRPARPGAEHALDVAPADPSGTRALRVVPAEGMEDGFVAGRPPDHRGEALAVVRRRDLARGLSTRPASARAVALRPGPSLAGIGLFALALVAVVAPWRIAVSVGSIVGLALAAAALVAGATALWPAVGHRGVVARTAVVGAATLALVLAFASGFAICARAGHLLGAGGAPPTVGDALSAAVSLGTAPDLRLGAGARSIAYSERLLLLLCVIGVGAQATARPGRRRL